MEIMKKIAYIEMAIRKIAERIKEHIRDLKYNKVNTVLAEINT